MGASSLPKSHAESPSPQAHISYDRQAIARKANFWLIYRLHQRGLQELLNGSKRKPEQASRAVSIHPLYDQEKGEEYMSEEQENHFRNLGAWKKSLMEEVDWTVHHMQDEAANFLIRTTVLLRVGIQP